MIPAVSRISFAFGFVVVRSAYWIGCFAAMLAFGFEAGYHATHRALLEKAKES